jgi:hypothetical protein
MNRGDFTGRLIDSERIVWSGRPSRGLLLTGRDFFLIPFSLLWGGFALFWEAMVLVRSAPGFFQLWGVPFVLFGLYLIAGRFIVDACLRANTSYAVTDRRVLIVRSGKTISLDLDRLSEIQLAERRNGSGTLRFGPSAVYWGRTSGGFGYWSPALDPTPQFIAIADARSVFDLIQRTARRAD